MGSTPPTVDEILVLQHSHLDVGYTHSQPIVWELQKEFISQALDWLERTADLPEDSRPKWTCEATEPVYRWLREAPPYDARRFRHLFTSGRIGIGALRWHAGGLADRAGLGRMLDGKDELEQFLGGPVKVACQHDVNGMSWPMSDLLLDAGVDLLVMGVNPYLGRPLDSRPGMFLWETPSGRRLRVFNGHHYTMFDQNFYSWEDSVDRMADGWGELAAHLERRGYGLDFVYLTSTASPVMWDNAPPNPYLPDLIQRWNEAKAGPRIRYATFDDLRERALAVPSGELSVVRGDWSEYWSHGYASTPIATAVNQRAKPMLAAAERLTVGAEHPTLQRARDSIDLYDEHTWGHWDTSPSHPQAQTGEILKAAMAHEGHELASFALMDGLERLSGNPVADRGVKGVLIANPGPDPVTVRPKLPVAWFPEPGEPLERTYRPSRMFFNRRPWGHEYPGEDAKTFGAIRLEPHSWRSISLDDLPAADDGGGTVRHQVLSRAGTRWEANGVASSGDLRRTGRIESPWHALEYDPTTGRILSLVDRLQERELLDLTSDFDLFSFVRERPDPLVDGSRFAYYDRDMIREKFDETCWKPWVAIRERATRVSACTVIESAEGISLERRLDAPGLLSLVQRFTFHADEPVIGVRIEMELVPEESPQGFYFALPLAMNAGWRAAFDTAGQLVELDADQIPGACRNWATTESLAAMWDDEGMVALLTPDAPMVQFGDFHFGPPLDAIPRPENPLLLAWPVNNYWDTNYAKQQPGRISLDYGLVTAATADLEAVQRHARALRQRPLVWPITTGGRSPGSGVLPATAAGGIPFAHIGRHDGLNVLGRRDRPEQNPPSTDLDAATDGYRDLFRQPDEVTVIAETGTVRLVGVEGVWSGAGLQVTVTPEADGMHVRLAAPSAKAKKVILQWKEAPEGADWKYLGDAWERSYGDLEWQRPDAERPMPWYFLASDGRTTHGYGVMTLPSAMCHWTRDAAGVTLTADVRSGGTGVDLGERILEVCTVVSRRGRAGETPFAAAHEFCVLLCPSPLMPEQPVYGFNNWYCDYGDITPEGVRQDAAFIARLAPAGRNRPYMVIDDGWQADYTPAAGAWDRGNARFPDMRALAADIVEAGAKPGIWVRLLLAQPEHPESWRQARDPSCLDPSVPEVRDYVVTTVKRLRAWGYELIKHDYSVLDLTGAFGFQSGGEVIPDGHPFADTGRTTAEIIVDHYRSIREATGDDGVVMGCTTFGHLSAGLFEISRTGDDTSGLEWGRVRQMGVNTMAFRMPQHGAFFAIDGDCVGQTSTGSIPWEKNRQWLDLLARSGTPLFVSFREGVTPDQEEALAAAVAASSHPMPVAEPLDWFDTLLPRRWRMSDSVTEFDWSDAP